MAKILIVEDDVGLAREVADFLRAKEYLVDVANTGADGRAYLGAAKYDLIVLDWELPDTSGPELCIKIRKGDASHVPILFLTARIAVADKVHGFETGADDYLTKPFELAELLARIRALLKRPPIFQSRQLTVRDIVLDLSRCEVTKSGERVELFPKEYALFEFLVSHPNFIYSAEDLMRHVWSTDANSSIETVRTTLMRLRHKLDTGDKPLIVTLRGIGYRLEP